MDELARYSLLAGYVRYIGERPDILDIGCGEGLLRRHLDGVPIGHYTGIDLCSTAIARARGLRDGFTTFLCADVMSTELASADLIVLNEVLYFADDPTAMLERIAGLLRPDGHLLVSIWRHAGDRHLWSNLRRHFRLEDTVKIQNPSSRLARRGWRVACYGPRTPPSSR
ncbi:MAG: class I SAM-dependent methyltransferase [Acidimicrobiales bacterium]